MDSAQKKILVVDDDEDIRAFMAYLVAKKFSAEVVQADSSRKAIELIKKGQDFWLIISDYHMVNENGNVLQDYLVSENIRSLFIFFTSDHRVYTNENHQFCLGVVAKPNTDILISRILKKLNNGYLANPVWEH